MKKILNIYFLFGALYTLAYAGDGVTNEFVATAGWGAPVGIGLEFEKYIVPAFNLNMGAGVTVTGVKLSVGTKYLMAADKDVSPYIGLNFSSSSGIRRLNINVDTDTAKYKINAAKILTPRAGLKLKRGFANFYLNVGYGIVVDGGGNKYRSGSTDTGISDMADLLSAGGVEISGSICFPIK
ncbi:MAG TPA: hypothetical protein PLG25_02420 [bacterium]|nr:hypothetical protein [bacterium]HMW33322.1 hypothetical protein [bacterium]HMW35596.1 hypothetical protein [bacterium]HMY35430.1 hypothetical protein [bacterium]HMZ03960.1 hypothetical protein [bacterium]